MEELFDHMREVRLSEVLGRVVFDLAGDDPGSVLTTIQKLRVAAEACEAKYTRMIRAGMANGAQPVQQPAERQGGQHKRGNGTRPPRRSRVSQPPEQPKPPETPAPLFADQTEGA